MKNKIVTDVSCLRKYLVVEFIQNKNIMFIFQVSIAKPDDNRIMDTANAEETGEQHKTSGRELQSGESKSTALRPPLQSKRKHLSFGSGFNAGDLPTMPQKQKKKVATGVRKNCNGFFATCVCR